VSGICSVKFYDPKNLGKQNQNH